MLEFSADGRRLLVVSRDGAHLWEVSTARELTVLAPSKGYVYNLLSAKFSPDGRRLVTAAEYASHGPDKQTEPTIQIWDVANGESLVALPGPREGVSAEFSPDGQSVLVVTRNRVTPDLTRNEEIAQLLDSTSGTEIATLQAAGKFQICRFSPDGRRVLTATGGLFGGKTEICLWDGLTGKEITGTRQKFRDDSGEIFAVFSGDSRYFANADSNSFPTKPGIKVWDAVTGKLVATLGEDGDHITALEFNSDGRLLLSVVAGSESSGPAPAKPSDRNRHYARVWDVASTNDPVTLREQGAGTLTALFNPKGDRVLNHLDRAARIWDSSTGTQVCLLTGHAGRIDLAAFSPDGRLAVTTSRDRTARVWDAETGREIATLKGFAGQARAATFSPDGRWLAILYDGWEGSVVRLWPFYRLTEVSDQSSVR